MADFQNELVEENERLLRNERLRIEKEQLERQSVSLLSALRESDRKRDSYSLRATIRRDALSSEIIRLRGTLHQARAENNTRTRKVEGLTQQLSEQLNVIHRYRGHSCGRLICESCEIALRSQSRCCVCRRILKRRDDLIGCPAK